MVELVDRRRCSPVSNFRPRGLSEGARDRCRKLERQYVTQGALMVRAADLNRLPRRNYGVVDIGPAKPWLVVFCGFWRVERQSFCEAGPPCLSRVSHDQLVWLIRGQGFDFAFQGVEAVLRDQE